MDVDSYFLGRAIVVFVAMVVFGAFMTLGWVTIISVSGATAVAVYFVEKRITDGSPIEGDEPDA